MRYKRRFKFQSRLMSCAQACLFDAYTPCEAYFIKGLYECYLASRMAAASRYSVTTRQRIFGTEGTVLVAGTNNKRIMSSDISGDYGLLVTKSVTWSQHPWSQELLSHKYGHNC